MNQHPSENDLRAVLDGELQPELAARIRAHASTCTGCAAVLRRLSEDHARVSGLLASLEHTQAERPAGPAWHRLIELRVQNQKETHPMSNRIFSRRSRPAWIALVAVMALGLSLAVPPVRAFATDLLGIFRVQQITILPVNMANFREIDNIGDGMQELLSDQVSYEASGEAQTAADAAEASQLAGFTVRLPDQPAGKIMVQPGVHGEIILNTEQINGILAEIGHSDAQLDPALDGRKIIVDTEAAVMAGFGECEPVSLDHESAPDGFDGAALVGEGCITLMQIPSPVVETPDELDIPMLGQIFLEMSGMSAEEAAAFSQRIDWSTTLIVPVPINSTDIEDVRVDGVSGSLVREDPDSGSPQYVILWVRDGIVYAVSGSGDPQAGLAVANGL